MEKIILTTQQELTELVSESVQNALERQKEVEETKREKDDPLFNLDEAKEYLKLTKATLYGYTSKGIVPHFKQGKRLLFRKSQLDNWLLSKQRGSSCLSGKIS